MSAPSPGFLVSAWLLVQLLPPQPLSNVDAALAILLRVHLTWHLLPGLLPLLAFLPPPNAAGIRSADEEAELNAMSLKALRRKARESKLPEEDVDEANDAADPKAAFVALLLGDR